MQLEKIVIDYHTFFCEPSFVNNLKNCVIYMSEYNVECFKNRINEVANKKGIEDFIKRLELEDYDDFVAFYKKNIREINKVCPQTDELEFKKDNNSFIVVVKDTKDVRLINEALKDKFINRAENESIYIGLLEGAQIITIKNSLSDFVIKNEIPVSCLNINRE